MKVFNYNTYQSFLTIILCFASILIMWLLHHSHFLVFSPQWFLFNLHPLTMVFVKETRKISLLLFVVIFLAWWFLNGFIFFYIWWNKNYPIKRNSVFNPPCLLRRILLKYLLVRAIKISCCIFCTIKLGCCVKKGIALINY